MTPKSAISGWADAPGGSLGERTQVHRHPLVHHALDFALFAQPGNQGRRFGFRLFDADAVPQPADHLHEFEPNLSRLEIGGWPRRVGEVDLGGRDRESEVARRGFR